MIVVGSSGMRGRKEFLLGNVSNRVTHLARCTVVVVNTTMRPALRRPPTSRSSCASRVEEIARMLGPMALGGSPAATVLRTGDDGERPARAARGPRAPRPDVRKARPDPLDPARPDPRGVPRGARQPPGRRPAARPRPRSSARCRAELGVPWEDVFASIEPEPLAAGTIGQVHRAELVDGTRVVVKVQRPNAASLVEADLALLETAMRPISRSNRVPPRDRPAVAASRSSPPPCGANWTSGEEAANLERMDRVLATYPQVSVPGLPRGPLDPPSAGHGRDRRRGAAERGATRRRPHGGDAAS